MAFKKVIQAWLIPLLIGVGIFMAGRPILADLLAQEEQLRIFLNESEIEVGSETIEGYQQAYYIYEGEKQFVTEGSRNSSGVAASGEYVAWVTSINGAGQIFLHHIPTSATVQLTHGSTNLNPTLYGNKVAWERWVNDRWQIFFFDGVRTVQLTEGDLAVEPKMTAEGVLFARKDEAGNWRVEKYGLNSKAIELVGEGLEAKRALLGEQQPITPVETPVVSLPPTETPSATPGDDTPTPEPTATITETPSPTDEPTPTVEPTPFPSAPPVVTEEEIEAELLASPEPDVSGSEEDEEVVF